MQKRIYRSIHSMNGNNLQRSYNPTAWSHFSAIRHPLLVIAPLAPVLIPPSRRYAERPSRNPGVLMLFQWDAHRVQLCHHSLLFLRTWICTPSMVLSSDDFPCLFPASLTRLRHVQGCIHRLRAQTRSTLSTLPYLQPTYTRQLCPMQSRTPRHTQSTHHRIRTSLSRVCPFQCQCPYVSTPIRQCISVVRLPLPIQTRFHQDGTTII